MGNNKEIESIEIFNGVIWQAQLLKSLLENAEIEAFLNDETIGSLNFPWSATGGLGIVKVIVSSNDYDNAKEVVAEFKKNLEENK